MWLIVVMNNPFFLFLGDVSLAVETLLTAIAVIKQSRVYSDERCRALVTSLKDCLFSIESKSYGSRCVCVWFCVYSQNCLLRKWLASSWFWTIEMDHSIPKVSNGFIHLIFTFQEETSITWAWTLAWEGSPRPWARAWSRPGQRKGQRRLLQSKLGSRGNVPPVQRPFP